MKRLILFLLLFGIFLSSYFAYSSLITTNSDKHSVQFSPSACFSCYGCSCDYTVDGKVTYTLNEFDKTNCLNFQGEIGQDTATVSLEGKDFDNFLKCVKQYNGIPSPIGN